MIIMDIKNFFNIKNFYLKEAIEESINLKYKNSYFFMLLYNNYLKKHKSEQSEDKILKKSINDYIDTFKNIIEKLESKMTLYKINNIELFINKTLNSEFDWDQEINFINQEFSFLNKKDYISNNLKNDFIFFVNIIKNKKIKSDKDFFNLYNKEMKKNNIFKINLNKLINKYFSFISNQYDKKNILKINKYLQNEKKIKYSIMSIILAQILL